MSTAIQLDLSRGERMLWSGQPRQGITFSAADAMMVPFSLAWGGFAIFWEVMVIRSRAPWVMRLFGVPFVLIGLYLIIGRFFTDAWRRRRLSYAVTSDRVMMINGGTITSFPLDSVGELAFTQRGDGSGTIMLGATGPLSGALTGLAALSVNTAARARLPMLENISDVKQVYDLIRSAQQDQKSPAGR